MDKLYCKNCTHDVKKHGKDRHLDLSELGFCDNCKECQEECKIGNEHLRVL